ncbi:ATP-dependent Clp protease ATP-binding subunit [Clostridium chauvoei]|uniref:ATP-dependent Clp protease ATP-binding subunit n=2 Tax=Clostridium chauvoei TaxID=46867 RepID=A0ABD4RHN6_9CLOT|nr:ATP-dependent Clp protease ATP-binding subunit [Clostridium chauvoei]ATD53904.1 ATP-dependent Clp protease ATP-binding subunit ClpC [Clostridium chauvoei]ATD58291.1 ATP-dependent Clp protease ATP-binding subunit ClpC [Clostridium chauvoei]MBX7280548.1 ATP-dependent Clp protease ATP-binding subunit [Clostridium chauvoei]MBX7283124.1 ATP-dependent Clp protease ATP-binding subunit [Clostridium chauvoei]MBX7285346.1 ATP-dependent Clp protease ATP-binding subunit [Clostridium chauvoei]
MIFGRFTERAHIVLVEAQKESHYFKHGYIGTEHILVGLLKEGGYAREILYSAGITVEKVKKVIEDYLGFGDDDISVGEMLLTPRAKRLFDDSLIKARNFNHNAISPEHILLALIEDVESVAHTTLSNYKVEFKDLEQKLNKYLLGSDIIDESLTEKMDTKPKKKSVKTPMLNQYGIDLTLMAKESKLDPVIGRDNENQRVLEILCRRIKNNPCLIGEPGVGKTAVVEGLAQRIVNGNIPEILKNKSLISLDLTSMIAGAKYRGEFEDRLKKVMEEIKSREDVIIFIDEIHTIVGAGGAEGAIDAANILKPALARGEIKCIGATTIEEYRKYIEKDSALERRFQPVNIGEPSKNETLEILKGLKDKYEAHHRVEITEEAIEAAVKLSDRYITDRFMPDKAIDLIDEAAAKVRIENLIAPPSIKDIELKIEDIEREKEEAIRGQDFEKAASLRDKENELKQECITLRDDWKHQNYNNKYVVTPDNIANVVSLWTQIPLEKLTQKESQRLLKLEDILHKRVIGQKEAVRAVSKAVKRARVGLKDPNRPIGSFIFCGPTGVGKTELSNALAEAMFGSEKNLVRIDMSEYMEKHAVARLIGSPPGYVGYDEGGQLTEAVRRNPYSVILLDEIEKAHPDVFNILLQIMEDGRLTDGKGKVINFKNTIIIMTSNIGAHTIKKQKTVGFETEKNNTETDYEKMKQNIMEEIKREFKPEFINRIDDIIVFHQLDTSNILQIVNIMLNNTITRLKERKITINLDDDSKKFLANKGVDISYGARPLRRIITKELEDKLSEEMLKGYIKGGDQLEVYCDGASLCFKHIS